MLHNRVSKSECLVFFITLLFLRDVYYDKANVTVVTVRCRSPRGTRVTNTKSCVEVSLSVMKLVWWTTGGLNSNPGVRDGNSQSSKLADSEKAVQSGGPEE
jgi:hypothetical protein